MCQELRNAFETSMQEWRAAKSGTDEALIAEGIARGHFVLVADIIRYCPRTDAVMGYDPIFEGSFPSKELAIAALDAIEAECPEAAEVIRLIAPPVYGCAPRPSEPPF